MSTTTLFFTCAFGFFAFVIMCIGIPTAVKEKHKSAKIKAEFLKQFD